MRYRILQPAQSWSKADPVSRWGKAHVAGNIVEGYPKVTANNWDGGVQFSKAPDVDATGAIAKGAMDDDDEIQKIIAQVRVDKPFPMPPMTMKARKTHINSVLKDAGATLPRRDAVDERVID